jgi:hypothetical protein
MTGAALYWLFTGVMAIVLVLWALVALLDDGDET